MNELIDPNMIKAFRRNGESFKKNEVVILRNEKSIIIGFRKKGHRTFAAFENDEFGWWDIEDENMKKLELHNLNSKYFFESTDSKYKKFNRCSVRVIRVIDEPTRNIDLEVLPMYEVVVTDAGGLPELDGQLIEAFHEELLNTSQAFAKYDVKPQPYNA